MSPISGRTHPAGLPCVQNPNSPPRGPIHGAWQAVARIRRARPEPSGGTAAVVAVLAIAVFMSSLDLFIVNLAFPSIGEEYAGAEPGLAVVDPQRVHDRVRGGAGPGWTVGRPDRAPARPGRRTGRVHRRVAALRPGPRGGLAGGGQDGAGGRRRRDGAGVAVAAAGRRPAGTARPRARVLVGARRPGRGPGAGDRWCPGRDRLALGVLGEPAGGGRGDPARPAPGAREPGRGAADVAPTCSARCSSRWRSAWSPGRWSRRRTGAGRRPASWACCWRRPCARERSWSRSFRHPAPGAGAGPVPVPDVLRRRSGVGPVLRGLRRLPPQHGRVPHHGLALLAAGGGAGHRPGAADGAAVRAAGRASADPRAGRGRAGRRPGLRGRRRRAGAVAGRSSRPSRPT